MEKLPRAFAAQLFLWGCRRRRAERCWRHVSRADGPDAVPGQDRSEIWMAPSVVGDLLDKIAHQGSALLLVFGDHLRGLRADRGKILPRRLPLPQKVDTERAAYHEDQNQDRRDKMAQLVILCSQVAHIGLNRRFEVEI